MKIAEQIRAFEQKRAALVAANATIMEKAAGEGATLDQAQAEEFDGNQADVDAIDGHLKRLRLAEKAEGEAAAPASGQNASDAGTARGGARVEVKAANLPKGTAFTRYAISLARSKGNLMQALEVSKAWRETTPEVETVLKAAVAAGTTTDPAWAAPLVEYQNMASEFAELLRPATIVGRIQGLRRVPFNIKIPRQTGGSSVGWVGQGAPKPVSALSFDQIKLGMAKAAGIVVMSDELVRASNPSAEAIVRQDLIDQTAQFLDVQFVDPTVAAVDGVSPASITNGVTPVVASGADADAVRHDVKVLMGKFVSANLSLASAVWIMQETMALGLSLMVNPLGQPEFPGLVINGNSGGTFMGLPVILSEAVPVNPGTGSGPVVGAGGRLILAKASEILLADDGETVIDASAEASLQMDSAPIETQLLQLNGDTAAIRERELAGLDASNQALQRQVYALQDQQAAATAAAQAEQEAAQAAAAIAQERSGLEQQLLQLQGDTAALRARELAALDPANRALQQQIYDLTDYQAAQAAAAQATADATQAAKDAADAAAQQAAAIAQERTGIQSQLWQLQGDTASIRATELAGLDASNRALMEQVYALTDQQAATQAATQAAQDAAQAEASIAQERAGLMNQLWQLTGDTASIRAAQLASLDPSNRALQEQIYAISDAQDAAKAAQALADAWKSVGDSIMDEITRIRGLGTTGGATFASLQGQFNVAVAAARGGDQDAAKDLPELSKSLLDAAALAATSRQELARVQAQTAGALQSVYDMIGSAVGTSSAATSAVLGTATSNDNAGPSADQWWSTFANTASAASAGAGNGDLVAAVNQLRAEVAVMRAENNKGHANTADRAGQGSDVLVAASRLGEGALAVEQAA